LVTRTTDACGTGFSTSARHRRAPAAGGPNWWPADWSCAAGVQRAAGDLLWAGGCHPLLTRAQSLDSALMTGRATAYWNQIVTTGDRILGPSHRDTLEADGG
jgi:hypothetical protein